MALSRQSGSTDSGPGLTEKSSRALEHPLFHLLALIRKEVDGGSGASLCPDFRTGVEYHFRFSHQPVPASSAGLPHRTQLRCPNGIDTSLFAPDAEARSSVRDELGLPGTALLIGVINRYHQMKDHANFLNAAGQIAQRYPDAHFLLAGRDVDPENRVLSELIGRLGLAGRTHLLGERVDIARLVAALDIFCLSSSHGESFPIIVGEAMASEIPCVVTDVGDVAWMVSETGQVVPPRNPEALGTACEGFLDLGPRGRHALGQAARARVVDLFSLSSIVARYEELYESTMVGTGEKSENPVRTYERLGAESSEPPPA